MTMKTMIEVVVMDGAADADSMTERYRKLFTDECDARDFARQVTGLRATGPYAVEQYGRAHSANIFFNDRALASYDSDERQRFLSCVVRCGNLESARDMFHAQQTAWMHD